MLEDFYTRPRAIARFMRAPLGPYMGSFADEMRARGHTHAVVRVQLCFVARLNRWLERHRLRVDELDETRLEEFLRSKYRKRGLGIPKTVSSFLEHLRRSGVVAVPSPTSWPTMLVFRGRRPRKPSPLPCDRFCGSCSNAGMSSATLPPRCRARRVGISRPCRRFSRPTTSAVCSGSAMGAPPLAEIERSWCCSRAWACEPARLFGSRWTTSTGTPVSSRSEARAAARIGCRCRMTSAQRLPLTSATSVRAAHRDAYSFGHVHRTTVSVVHHRSVPSYVGSFAGPGCDEDAAPRTCFDMLPPPRCFVGERRFMSSATRSVTAICEAR